MSDSRTFPGFWQTIGLLAMIAFLQMIAAFIFAAFGIRNLTAGHLAAVNLVTISLGLWLGLVRSQKSFSELFPMHMGKASLAFAAFVTIAGGIILLSETDNLMRSALPPPDWLVRIFEELTSGEQGMLGSILALVVVAPFTEEFLFRGLILNGFLGRYSRWQAILLSSFLFAVFHFNPWQFIGAFALGALFAWLYVQTGSLFLPVLGHALNNALPLIISKVDLNIPGFTAEIGAAVEFQPLWFDVTGLLLFLGGLWLLRTQFAAQGGGLQQSPSAEESV